MKPLFQIRSESFSFYKATEEIKILHLSDIHIWFSSKILNQIKAKILSIKPKLVLMTGDFFDFPYGAKLFKIFMKEIAQIQPVIFIRGNHEFFYGKNIANSLIGIPNCFCVENEVYTLNLKNGYSINVASLKIINRISRLPNQLNIGLLHNPETLGCNDTKNVDLILAGHLHGGQFILCQTKDGNHFPASLFYKNCFDRKSILNTTVLVSKGLGDTLPFRFNCPKEIIELTIR